MRKTLKKGSAEAKAFMAKLRAKKRTVKKTVKRVAKNAVKSFKDGYNGVGAVKSYAVIKYNKKHNNVFIVDVVESKRYNLRKNTDYKDSTLLNILDSKTAANKEANRLYKSLNQIGSTLLIEKGENPRKKPTRVLQVNRTKKGTFKTFKSVSGVKKHTNTKSRNVSVKVGSVYENTMPTGKKMYAQINEFAYIYASASGGKLKEYLTSKVNQWVEIDTNYLFDDQYNTVDGFRIYDTMISAIKNDARIGIKQFENSAECCFLKWNGIKPYPRPLPKELPTSIAKQNQQFKNEYLIGTYRLNIVNQHYCLQNGRQSIKFLFYNGDYYLTTGIGYRMRLNLSGGYPVQYPIPTDVKKKLFKIMNSI